MVSAEQRQVVKIGQSAENPIHYVVPVAPARRLGAAGEGASGVSGDPGHGLAGEASRRDLPNASGTPW